MKPPMLDRALLANIRTIIVHDECSDGMASAILLHDALPNAEVRFVQYATEAHRSLVASAGMLFCDFSPPRERAAEFVTAGAIVLDHHGTARDIVASFGSRGVFGDEEHEPGVSGAVLALRHVWDPIHAESPHHPFAERFATLAGIRDTWQTANANWQAACAQHQALLAFSNQEWIQLSFDEIAQQWDSRFAWLGRVLVRKNKEQVERALAGAFHFENQRLRVLAFDGIALTSDAAEAARDRADLVIGFGFEGVGGLTIMRVSLRSNNDFDVAAIASRYGGGGHRRAAGFALPLGPADPQPFVLIMRLLDESTK